MYIKMPSTNFSVSVIPGKMKSNSKILNNMLLKIIKYRASQEGK